MLGVGLADIGGGQGAQLPPVPQLARLWSFVRDSSCHSECRLGYGTTLGVPRSATGSVAQPEASPTRERC